MRNWECGMRNAERKKEDRVLNGELMECGMRNAERKNGMGNWECGMRKELYGAGHKA